MIQTNTKNINPVENRNNGVACDLQVDPGRLHYTMIVL